MTKQNVELMINFPQGAASAPASSDVGGERIGVFKRNSTTVIRLDSADAQNAAGSMRVVLSDGSTAINATFSGNFDADLSVSGAGGIIAAASRATDTLYYIFAISSDDGVTNQALLMHTSNSLVLASLPSGYTRYSRALFAMWTNSTGSGEWPTFKAGLDGRSATFPPQSVFSSFSSTSKTTYSLAQWVPSFANFAIVRVAYQNFHTGGTTKLEVTSDNGAADYIHRLPIGLGNETFKSNNWDSGTLFVPTYDGISTCLNVQWTGSTSSPSANGVIIGWSI